MLNFFNAPPIFRTDPWSLKPPFQPWFYANKKGVTFAVTPWFSVSGYQDSNLGPPAPKAYYYHHHFYIQTSEYQYLNSNIFWENYNAVDISVETSAPTKKIKHKIIELRLIIATTKIIITIIISSDFQVFFNACWIFFIGFYLGYISVFNSLSICIYSEILSIWS